MKIQSNFYSYFIYFINFVSSVDCITTKTMGNNPMFSLKLYILPNT